MDLQRADTALFTFAENMHIWFFGHGMGQQTKKLLKNLSWSFLGGIGASITMLGVNVLAGRYLGPVGYGQYGLILTISQIIMIPLIFGLDISSVRSIPMAKSIFQKSKDISNVFYFILFSSFIIIALFIILGSFISEKFQIDSTVLFVAVMYAVITSFKSIADSIARGLFLFKQQFFARILEVGTIVSLFSLFFFYLEKQSYIYYILTLLGGSILFILWLCRGYVQFIVRFDFHALKAQLSFSSILLAGTVLGTAFNSLDKLIIVKYLSVQDLGIYMAYYMASTNLIAQATQIFMNVLFPHIASLEGGNYFKQIEKLFAILFIPSFLSISFIIWLIITLFGKDFGLMWGYVFSFGLLAVLQIIYTVYASVITAISKDLYKKFLLAFNIVNLVHVGLYGILIYFNRVSIIAIVVLFIFNIFVIIQLQRSMLKDHFQSKGTAGL